MCLALYPQAGSERAGGINPVEQCWEEKCCLCLQRSFSPPTRDQKNMAGTRSIPGLVVWDCGNHRNGFENFPLCKVLVKLTRLN